MTATRSALDAPWLASVPDSWSTSQLRRVATFRNGADYKEVEVTDGGYPVYGSGGEFRRASNYLFEGDSVLFGRKGTVDRPLLVHGRFWTVDTMFYTEIDARLEPRFLHYYATTMPFDFYRTSTAVPSMTQSDLGGHVMPLPDRATQRAIAEYLDREAARIDMLIAKQEQLIATLRERKRATIAAASVGSFNPLSATGSPSMTVGTAFSVVLGKMLDAGRQPTLDDLTLPYVRAANIQDAGLDLSDVNSMPYLPREAAALDLKANDLLVVEGGASVGTSVALREDILGWSFQKTVNRARPRNGACGAWLGYVLRTYRDAGVIDTICSGSTFAHLTAEKLRALRIPHIETDRQWQIAAELDDESSRIDTLVAKTQRFIELSKERRGALITAAVTGQIDVMGKAA